MLLWNLQMLKDHYNDDFVFSKVLPQPFMIILIFSARISYINIYSIYKYIHLHASCRYMMIHVLPGHSQLRCPRRCRGCRGCRGCCGCRGWCGRSFSQLTLEKHQLHRGTHLGAVRTTWSPGWKKVIQNDPNG